MRSFEERKAEVLRRSECRIKKRKRNRRCILSFCLVLTVCAAGLLPTVVPRESEDAFVEHTNSSVMDTDAMGTIAVVQRFVSVQVERGEERFFITDTAQMNWIWVQLENSFFAEDVLTGGVVPGPDCDIADEVPYRITITQSDGDEQIFILTGYQLYDVNKNRTFPLHHDQWEGLMEAFGLTEGEGA